MTCLIVSTISAQACVEARTFARECAGIVVHVKPSAKLKDEIRARGGLTEEEKKFYNSVADNNENLREECP